MATDVEESDTDDHERPAPPKRHCTRLDKVNETCWDTEKHQNESNETVQDIEDMKYDSAERHAREKLIKWQTVQLAKGFVDNTINKVLENYIMRASSDNPPAESIFHFFRRIEMEDTAVAMAIHNHGLVQSAELVSHSHVQDVGRFSNSLATTSSDTLRLNNSIEVESYNGFDWDEDKANDSDQQEDVLERAVAEAIKKKGLSALSVDYG